jgi:hypothetical protein
MSTGCARTLFAHHRQDGAGDVHRADEPRRQLILNLAGRQFLEVAPIEVGGVVDQHVDASESVNSRLDRGLGVLRAGDVQLHDQQVLGLAHGGAHSLGVAAGGDDRVPGG